MELAILEFSEKFMYENKVCITPSVLCKFLDALVEKFNSSAQSGPTNTGNKQARCEIAARCNLVADDITDYKTETIQKLLYEAARQLLVA